MCGRSSVTHTQSRNTPGLLTIRLLPLRYFSTSSKLRTETLALGIIILCVRAVRGPDASFQASSRVTSYLVSMLKPVPTHRALFLAHRRKHVKRTDADTGRLRSTCKKCARNSASPCVCTAIEGRSGFSRLLKKQKTKKKRVKKGSQRH